MSTATIQNNQSIFVKVLEMGEAAGIHGIPATQIETRAQDCGIDLGGPNEDKKGMERRTQLLRLVNECFNTSTSYDPRNEKHVTTYVLKSEYYFKLIQFRELMRSAESSDKRSDTPVFTFLSMAVLVMMLGFGIGQQLHSSHIEEIKAYTEKACSTPVS